MENEFEKLIEELMNGLLAFVNEPEGETILTHRDAKLILGAMRLKDDSNEMLTVANSELRRAYAELEEIAKCGVRCANCNSTLTGWEQTRLM